MSGGVMARPAELAPTRSISTDIVWADVGCARLVSIRAAMLASPKRIKLPIDEAV